MAAMRSEFLKVPTTLIYSKMIIFHKKQNYRTLPYMAYVEPRHVVLVTNGFAGMGYFRQCRQICIQLNVSYYGSVISVDTANVSYSGFGMLLQETHL